MCCARTIHRDRIDGLRSDEVVLLHVKPPPLSGNCVACVYYVSREFGDAFGCCGFVAGFGPQSISLWESI